MQCYDGSLFRNFHCGESLFQDEQGTKIRITEWLDFIKIDVLKNDKVKVYP